MLRVKSIDAIFKKIGDDYKGKSRVYQDIIIFGSTIAENGEFKSRDLAKYLRHNNMEFRNRYIGSKLSESKIIENIVRGVKRNVDALVGLHLIIQVGEVKQERGSGFVPIFKYTPFGYIFSHIIQSLQSGKTVEAKLYDTFQHMLTVQPDYAQSHLIFISNWLKKMHEKGYFGHYVSILKKVINSESIPNIEEFASILQRTVNIRFFRQRANAVIYMGTWEETINELEDEVRRLYFYDLKLSIDVRVDKKSTTSEYERLRLSLLGDVEVIALEGYCTECKQRSVLQMKIVRYYWRLAHAFTPLNGLAMQCPKCNSPRNTLRLPNVWLEDHPFYN